MNEAGLFTRLVPIMTEREIREAVERLEKIAAKPAEKSWETIRYIVDMYPFLLTNSD